MARVWPLPPLAGAPARLAALLALVCPALGACASSAAQPEAPPAGRLMLIGGEGYVVQQLTPGTWTASPQRVKVAENAPEHKAAVEQAIENASGCKVTDSYYPQTGGQLDAQVQCPGLSN